MLPAPRVGRPLHPGSGLQAEPAIAAPGAILAVAARAARGAAQSDQRTRSRPKRTNRCLQPSLGDTCQS